MPTANPPHVVPPHLRDHTIEVVMHLGLDPDQTAKVRELVGRAYADGHQDGRTEALWDTARQREQQRQKEQA